MKRLGIFFFYEKNGDVDDFITYYLRDLARNLTELIVVCNGKLSKQGRAAFEEFTDQIIVRENKGLDVWAYKTALDHYGWQRLSEFDEVVMTNSTLMGPVRPLKEMFDAMAERTNLDFWGLTIHHGAEGNPFKGKHLYNYLPVHIQSHFIVYRKKFIQSKELQNYWDTMPMIESYTDSVQRYESVFTKQFADKGYQWDVYVNTDDLKEFTDYPLLVCPTRLLRDKKCPLFKRRSFMHDFEAYLNDTAGEPVRELYAYLRDHTDYPLELIWKNMIRTMHPYDFTRNLGLTRLIPERVQDEACAAAVRKNRRIALCMHLYFMDMLPQSCAFAANMPPETDVFISTNTPEKKQQIEEAFRTLPLHAVTVKVVENRGRDAAAFLCDLAPQIREYDYACFMHDKKAIQTKPGSVGASFGYVCNENICKNADYVLNVLTEFEKDPYLGLLCPPFPTHGVYFMNMCSNGWGPNFDNTKALMKRLGIDRPISGEKMPIAPFGSVFWFRVKALAPLFDHGWKHEDFPPEPLPQDGTISHAIERIYPFVAQGAGYYPAQAMSADYAVARCVNDIYADYNGSVEEFAIDYANSYIYNDFGPLYSMFSPIVDMDIKDPDNPNDLAQMDGYVYDDTESAYVRLYIYTDAEGNVMAKSFYVTDDDALTVMDEICSGVNHTAWYGIEG